MLQTLILSSHWVENVSQKLLRHVSFKFVYSAWEHAYFRIVPSVEDVASHGTLQACNASGLIMLVWQ